MLFDYTQVTAAGVAAATDQALARADALVARMVDPATPATYDNTLGVTDEIGDLLEKTYGQTAFMGYVHPDKEVRDAGNAAEERLQKWGVELVFRDDFYQAIKRFSETEEAAGLAEERRRLLDFTLRDLRRAGHELDPEVRAEVKALTQRLVELGILFQRNIDEHQDWLIVTREDLAGLPDTYIEGLEKGEEEGTFKVGMSYPDVVPFLENADRRDLREQLARKFNSRAIDTNSPLLDEAVAIRQKIATLFGQPSWAHHQLEERMAKTPEEVHSFYRNLIAPLTEKGRDEIVAMEELLAESADEGPLQVYDFRYYETKLRKRDYGVDPIEVASYFPLQQVVDGMLELTGEVFGLEYRRVNAPTWHPDVITYAIHDRADSGLIAHFYMDLFPREGKYSHAAAFPLVPGRLLADGSYQQPVAAIVANFTKPGIDRPSLLQHSEVETFFHEFGHILHQTLTKAELVRFAGSNTERDFVEAPSQIMENWTWRPEVLRRFARHYQSGEPIPDRLVEQLTAAKNLNIALNNLRQTQFGLLDMWLHDESSDKNVEKVLRRAVEVSLFPFHEGTFFPASFGHLLGGYDAGYYGYLWSEVYGDDMWSRFAREGVTNPEVGMAYRRQVLEKGGSVDGMEMLQMFLGREPNNEAFLAKLGIGTKSSS
ncbi:MAG TPA: M3 family metallopeptidase [Acidimicrobiia bacterium]|nr:M3 family metallopeptidase [Acidimicrobiia bacterium]